MALPSLVSCKLVGIPQVREELTNRSHTAVFNVEVSHNMPAYAAIKLAQNSGKLPSRRDTFAFTIDGQNYIDQDVEAQSFTSAPQGDGSARKKHTITVEFRTIQPQTQGTPDPLTPPLQREPEWGTEWLSEQEVRDKGVNIQTIKYPDRSTRLGLVSPSVISADSDYGPITNAAGFPFSSYPSAEARRPVLYFKRNVLSPFAHINIYNDFRQKINANTWDVFGLKKLGLDGGLITARNALFLEVVTGPPQYYGETRFFEMTVRVVLDNNEWKVNYPNRGNKVWEDDPDNPGTFRLVNEVDGNGQPLSPPFEMNYDGEARTTETTEHTVQYRTFDVANFDALTRAIFRA